MIVCIQGISELINIVAFTLFQATVQQSRENQVGQGQVRCRYEVQIAEILEPSGPFSLLVKSMTSRSLLLQYFNSHSTDVD